MAKHIYLIKRNDTLVSHCRCPDALITSPPQMDCPWCGCGWLFTCLNCRKAFTFAQGVEVDVDWNDLAARDLQGRSGKPPSADDVRDWVEFMQIYLKGVEPGQTYVAFDGWTIDVKNTGVRIEGWHAKHDLAFVPQVRALTDSAVLRDVLANPKYWQDRAIGASSK